MVTEAVDRYRERWPAAELVEFVDGAGFAYVYDLAGASDPSLQEARAVVGWGSARSPRGPRDASRIRGFPLPRRLRADHDRGHLFSYAAGGGEDVNLVAQLRVVNRGWSAVGRRWRAIERLARRRPDAVLVVDLDYDDMTAVPATLRAALIADEGVLASASLSNR